MTREECIEILDKFAHHSHSEVIKYPRKVATEAFEMAIAALKAESCEDVVSRQAVNDLVDELARAISDERCCISRGRSTATIMQDILDLPPVTPKPRTGKWIDDKCSVCGKGIEDLISSPEWYRNEEPKFCPYCGIKLEGENE